YAAPARIPKLHNAPPRRGEIVRRDRRHPRPAPRHGEDLHPPGEAPVERGVGALERMSWRRMTEGESRTRAEGRPSLQFTSVIRHPSNTQPETTRTPRPYS